MSHPRPSVVQLEPREASPRIVLTGEPGVFGYSDDSDDAPDPRLILIGEPGVFGNSDDSDDGPDPRLILTGEPHGIFGDSDDSDVPDPRLILTGEPGVFGYSDSDDAPDPRLILTGEPGTFNTPPKKKRKPRLPKPKPVREPPRTPMHRPAVRTPASRRKPRTPHYALRSSRLSPPRFGDEDLAARGSPRHPFGLEGFESLSEHFAALGGDDFRGDDDWGAGFGTPRHSPERRLNTVVQFDIDDNDDNEIQNEHYDLFQFPQLSITEKIAAIKERLQERVPEYWNILRHLAFSYSRISERCFCLQDWDMRRDILKVTAV